MTDRDALESKWQGNEAEPVPATQKRNVKRSEKLLYYGSAFLFCVFLQPMFYDWPLKYLPSSAQTKFHVVRLVGLPVVFWYAFLRRPKSGP